MIYLLPTRVAPSFRHMIHTEGPVTAPVGPNADSLAPWFRRNYAGINDGSPQIYFSTLSVEPSGRGPKARQLLCQCSAGGRNFFAKVYAGRQRDLVFLFQCNYGATTHSHFFPLSGQQDCSNHLPQTKTCSHLIFSLSLTFWICIYKMSLNEPYWFPPGSCHGCIFVCLSMWLQEKNAGTSSETHHSRLSHILLNVSSVKSEDTFQNLEKLSEFLDFWITEKERNFWSKSTCTVVLAKNVKRRLWQRNTFNDSCHLHMIPFNIKNRSYNWYSIIQA